MAIEITNPFKAELTERVLSTLSTSPISPVYIGDDYSLRFQVLTAAGVAQSLSGASVLMTITASSSAEITRATSTAVTGSSPTKYQILIDSDQSTETGETGKGWYQVNFTHYAEDITSLTTVAGRNRVYNIKVTLADNSVFTHLKGHIDILDPEKE